MNSLTPGGQFRQWAAAAAAAAIPRPRRPLSPPLTRLVAERTSTRRVAGTRQLTRPRSPCVRNPLHRGSGGTEAPEGHPGGLHTPRLAPSPVTAPRFRRGERREGPFVSPAWDAKGPYGPSKGGEGRVKICWGRHGEFLTDELEPGSPAAPSHGEGRGSWLLPGGSGRQSRPADPGGMSPGPAIHRGSLPRRVVRRGGGEGGKALPARPPPSRGAVFSRFPERAGL